METGPGLGLSVPRANRVEVGAVVAATLALHVVAVMHLARAHASVPARRQEVVIELSRPPPPPPPKPPEIKPEPPPPAAAAPPPRAAPRVKPLLRPVVEPPQAAKPDELPALPEGDDPALASASGSGEARTVEPEPAPPPPPPPPPAPAPVIAAHEGANYLKNPRPGYPAMALRRGLEGEVLLAVQVGANGRPLTVRVKRSSGIDLLDEAAVEAVRAWTFVPARQGGAAVPGWVTVPIVFELK